MIGDGDQQSKLLGRLEREKPRYQAMSHLAEIVGTSRLKHDIKRINKAQSLKGARKWAMKHGTLKNPYTATEEDIDEDGIKDVVVRDVDGNLVVINGYTVKPTEYPYRQLFYGYSKADRKRLGNYKNAMRDRYEVEHDPTTGEFRYGKNPEDDDFYQRLHRKGFKTYVPKPITTYQRFTKSIIKPLVDNLFKSDPDVYSYRRDEQTGEYKFPPILIQCAAYAWNLCVVRPIIEQVTNEKISTELSPDEYKEMFNRGDIAKFRKGSEFKRLSDDLVTKYINEDASISDLTRILVDYIPTAADRMADEWKNSRGLDFEYQKP